MSESIQILDGRQIKGLNKIGDAFIPGDEKMPKFSDIGCADHAARILAFVSEQDGNDLKTAWWHTGPALLDIIEYDVSVYTGDLKENGRR